MKNAKACKTGARGMRTTDCEIGRTKGRGKDRRTPVNCSSCAALVASAGTEALSQFNSVSPVETSLIASVVHFVD